VKRSILSIILLALIISLTITVGSANLTTPALAIENYLQLRSAIVNYHGGDIDVDIRTGGNIPSESGNNGFGYAVLTDVGDESVDNALVAVSNIGIKSTKNDKLNTYVLDLTGDTTRACSGSDYEVTKSSSDNEGFDTSYPIDVEGNKISIDDVDTEDLASGTIKATASFSAEAITNNGKIKQICIDIQDVLKQSEISVSYNNDDDDGNRNGDDDEDDHDDNDDDRRRYDKEQDDCDIGDAGFPFCDGREDENDSTDGEEDDCDIGDAGFPFCDGREGEGEEEDSDDNSGIDIDQDIDQSNECSGNSVCSNEGSNQVDVFESENSVDDDGFDLDSDISQSKEQSNECNNEASCSNEANNEANVFGSSAGDDEDFDFGSDVDISQSIEQSNTCSGVATCSNFASNVANIS
jgi:hypothetical protein